MSMQYFYFRNREEWREWLSQNHSATDELWLAYYKKHTGKPSVIYREALEEALCFGWIDGMIKRIDDETYIQRFTPRRKKSRWSQTNIRLALKLLEAGKMHESGLKFREYWSPEHKDNHDISDTVICDPSWEERLNSNPLAAGNFRNMSPSNQKLFLRWIMAAKREETRMKRMAETLAMLERNEKLGMK